jgi:hypothetical protein
MTNKALCVGINAYAAKPLRGCVNDAVAWGDLLAAHYDFPRAGITLLTDAQATKAGVMSGLKKLLANASSGDVLVFTNSSHGTQVLDKGDGDETVDEVMCSIDFPNEILVDDDLRGLFSVLPAGVHLTVISDSCHSGSGTRLGDDKEPVFPDVYDSRERWFDVGLLPMALRPTGKALATRKETYGEEDMNEILLAGCKDSESSYDARFGDRFEGVMTHYALEAIRAANYHLTYADLAASLTELFLDSSYKSKQTPQLEGRAANKGRQIFT